MLQPSVVEPVSETCSGSTPTSAARAARTSVRNWRWRSKYGFPTRPLLEVGLQLLLHGLECRPGERAERTGVEIGDALEDREERARLCRRHPIVTSTGA